jgi:hypothetical protein
VLQGNKVLQVLQVLLGNLVNRGVNLGVSLMVAVNLQEPTKLLLILGLDFDLCILRLVLGLWMNKVINNEV